MSAPSRSVTGMDHLHADDIVEPLYLENGPTPRSTSGKATCP
ncbi:hypothetical protein [Streptomyces sp. MK5]|nr:hypothetical protein [Streptomyces sp. MK5]